MSDNESVTVELTEDEFYWVKVAIEEVRSTAIRISGSDDEEEASEGNYLVDKWNRLQEKFPPIEIRLEDVPEE